MKIGILSMQKIHNYGSFLQAFSLKLQLEKRGHDVYFIDILAGRQIVIDNEKNNRFRILSKFDKYFFKRIENYFFSKKMYSIHINDYTTYLETDKQFPCNENYDLVIIGSDEVFNATAKSPWGFSTQLFGDIKNAKKVVTYAASCGHTTYDSTKEYDIADELRAAMLNLSHISVRDNNTFDFVKNILSITPDIHLDPVFITDFDDFIPNVKSTKPYMLIYAYGNRICDEREITVIKNYAKKYDLDIICVGMQQRWCKHNITASAFELLSYLKGAQCVVTDTFHGTVFSIKYNKQFVSFIRESNKNKLGGLLNRFELDTRAVHNTDNFESVMNTDINFEIVNSIIKAERQKSYNYIETITKQEG